MYTKPERTADVSLIQIDVTEEVSTLHSFHIQLDPVISPPRYTANCPFTARIILCTDRLQLNACKIAPLYRPTPAILTAKGGEI